MPAEKIHLIGVGGSGMSGLAKILLAKGHTLSGSDLKASETTEQLGRLGVRVSIGHREENIPEGTEVVVRSAAIRDDNPELTRSKELGVRVLKYSQMVGQLSKEKETVAIAGTHGKTTTAAMISHILETANLTPCYLIGAPLLTTGTNASWGRGAQFVVEACEFDRSFLNLQPRYLTIGNIDEDHLDYYRNLGEIVQAFEELCGKVPEEGHLFIGVDNPNSARVAEKFRSRCDTIGRPQEADWRATNLAWEPEGMRFEVVKYGKIFDEFVLGVHGEHNVENALVAIACTTFLGVGKEIIQLALSRFRGTRRRMEVVAQRNGTVFVDDYAHHPVEIQATLRALKRRFPGKPIWCIFQPHQQARTRYLLKDFARGFRDADVVLVSDIYRVRDDEKNGETITGHDLAKEITAAGKPALYLPTFEELEAFVDKKAGPNAVVVTMGAGNVDELAKRLVNKAQAAV
jgi:UDP-N-acetylmuramate--alanine ligase